MKILVKLLIFFLFPLFSLTQTCSDFNIQLLYDIPSTCGALTMTMKHDIFGRNFLYVASKDGGLKIYDISGKPFLVKTISVSSFHSLDVMNLSQSGNYLYLALGNHFSSNQNSGIAVVDVSSPGNASVTGLWFDSKLKGGAGIVETEGNYAYLGAMGNGLIILDITNKINITFVSRFIPPMDFPDKIFDKTKISARGMTVKSDIVYLCYDAGGLRIINVSDKNKPVEAGRYSNPVMKGKPRAYNNIIVDDGIAYVTADYCGLEILNVSNPNNINQMSWWNPWKCDPGGFLWFSSPGHANEIAYDKDCKLLFLSTGKSDLHVINVSNPNKPDSCGYYGGVFNNLGTWGVSVYDNQIYLSYICSFIPFVSTWTGVKILSYNNKCR